MPTDPIYAITSTLASDMGGTIINWNYGANNRKIPPARPNPTPPAPVSPQQPPQGQGQPMGQPAGRTLSQ